MGGVKRENARGEGVDARARFQHLTPAPGGSYHGDMPKPTAPDLELLDLMPDAQYWEMWDAHARLAVQSLLTFHGACDSNVATTAAQTAAQVADAIMQERLLRMAEIKEAVIQRAKEESAKEKTKGKR